MKFCPRCGSVARVLLNLVGCITPACRNYEPKWLAEWQQRNTQKHRHHDRNHVFLGSFEDDGTTYDLYHFVAPNGTGICFARFGNSSDDCYYVDDKQTEIGRLSVGAVTSLSKSVQAALKEALDRSPRNKSKKP